MSVGITDRVEQNGQTLSDVWLKRCEDLAARILPSGEDHGINRLFLPGFVCSILMKHPGKRGWDIEDYLPQCGISSTASAFGLARAFLTKKSALVVHGNHHASGRQALVALPGYKTRITDLSFPCRDGVAILLCHYETPLRRRGNLMSS